MTYDFPMIIPAAWQRISIRIGNMYWKVVNAVALYLSGVKHGKGVGVGGKCRFLARHYADIVLGEHVIIESRFAANYAGLTGPAIFDTLRGGHIEIGDNTGMSSPILSSCSSISIGRRCKIGGNVRIYDHDFHSLEAAYRSSSEDAKHIRTKPILIGDDVFIGANAIILKGTCIGNCSIIAAGSVVFGLNIPPNSMVKGNPAQVIYTREKK